MSADHFKFKKHDNIGSSAAEDDEEFLHDCFYDAGDLSALLDCNNPKSIVIGRTGSGKSALLLQIKQQADKNATILQPDDLSIKYLSNSTIIKALDDLKINMDLFYKLLWKHILAVELIRLRFNIRNEEDQDSFLTKIFATFNRDKKKEKALEYLKDWGSRFWEDTEIRVKEITNKLEQNIQAALGSKMSIVSADASALAKMSTEEKAEVRNRIQEVVSGIQIAELNNVLQSLSNEYFNDSQQRFYILIDRLDENWIEDPIRYRMIRALVEVIRDFSKFRSSKVLVAIRRDLLNRVVRFTRDAGFQEEKYRSFYLTIKWTKDQLLELLDKRVSKLVSRQYTKKPVGWRDILPEKIGKVPMKTFLIDRTLYRPRDLLEFFNFCIEEAFDKNKLNNPMIKKAEARFSEARFRSLADEWFADYPSLMSFTAILKSRENRFTLNQITDDELEELAIECAANGGASHDFLWNSANELAESHIDSLTFKRRLFQVFHLVGLVGLKPNPSLPVIWSFKDEQELNTGELIINDSTAYISPIFYRALAVIETKT